MCKKVLVSQQFEWNEKNSSMDLFRDKIVDSYDAIKILLKNRADNMK